MTEPLSPATKPFPSGTPHIAYVTLWYPLFTQPFIFIEAENLRSRLPLKVYSLYGENLRRCSKVMLEARNNVERYGVMAAPAILATAARSFGHDPKLVSRLARRALIRKWPSLEVFGENLWGFLAGLTLGRRFKEDGMDMVYAPWPRGAATAAMTAAFLAGLPFGLSARGDNLNPVDPDLKDKLAAAAFIRANNRADQRRIAEFADVGDKTFLVYNSLTLGETDRRAERFANKATRLLAVGRFDVTKGFDILLKACAILANEGVDFKLTLAGGGGRVMGLGGMEKELRALRQDLGLEALVDLPGLVSHDALPSLLASHDIFVAPCVIHSSGRRDGIPNTVIEAMAAAMPIVSTSVNALPEVIIDGETGLLAPERDPHALARAIKAMIRDPERAKRMGEKAAALAREMFDPDRNSQKFAQHLADAFRKAKDKTICAE